MTFNKPNLKVASKMLTDKGIEHTHRDASFDDIGIETLRIDGPSGYCIVEPADAFFVGYYNKEDDMIALIPYDSNDSFQIGIPSIKEYIKG